MLGSRGHQALLEDCPGGSLIFGMVQSGLSLYESVWVIHMHYMAFNILHLSESKYSQIKPKLKIKISLQIKVARYSFSASIPPKFEHKLCCHKQRFGKIATTVVLGKDENWLLSGLQQHWSRHSKEMMLLSILLAAVYLSTWNCSSKIVYGSFFLQ